jgi:hypothetical protein
MPDLGTLNHVPELPRDYHCVGLVGATQLPLLRRPPGFPPFSKMLHSLKASNSIGAFRPAEEFWVTYSVWPFRSHIITEGQFMSRRLLAICICVNLALLSGCVLCRARHAARDCWSANISATSQTREGFER